MFLTNSRQTYQILHSVVMTFVVHCTQEVINLFKTALSDPELYGSELQEAPARQGNNFINTHATLTTLAREKR